MNDVTNIKIAETVTSLDAAIEAAKARGNDIYAGFENNIAMERQMAKEFKVTEWHITEEGTVLYVCDLGRHMKGQKTLQRLSLGSSLTNAPLCLGMVTKDHGKIVIVNISKVDKNDRKARQEACEHGLVLVDMYLAAELAA